jgi:hypothetical protein
MILSRGVCVTGDLAGPMIRGLSDTSGRHATGNEETLRQEMIPRPHQRRAVRLVAIAEFLQIDLRHTRSLAPSDGFVTRGVRRQGITNILRGEERREAVDGGGIPGQLPQVGLSLGWSGQKSSQQCQDKALAHNAVCMNPISRCSSRYLRPPGRAGAFMPADGPGLQPLLPLRPHLGPSGFGGRCKLGPHRRTAASILLFGCLHFRPPGFRPSNNGRPSRRTQSSLALLGPL